MVVLGGLYTVVVGEMTMVVLGGFYTVVVGEMTMVLSGSLMHVPSVVSV